MNKGRNIFILMIACVCVSLLAFLTLLERGNTKGVVDGVRYYLASTEDDVKTYEFYFAKDDMTSAEVTENASGEHTFIFEDWSYIYVVSGTDRENCKVEAIPMSGPDLNTNNQVKPFDKYSEDLFKVMVFGKKDVLSLWQAVIVAFIAVIGGCFILFAEELWHIFKRKGKDEYPEWKEMNIYKYIGGGTIAFAVVLLLLFVFI